MIFTFWRKYVSFRGGYDLDCIKPYLAPFYVQSDSKFLKIHPEALGNGIPRFYGLPERTPVYSGISHRIVFDRDAGRSYTHLVDVTTEQ